MDIRFPSSTIVKLVKAGAKPPSSTVTAAEFHDFAEEGERA